MATNSRIKMIIHDKKIIYIHINKCGGSSIESFFLGKAIGEHKTIRDFEDDLGNQELNNYFKFSFVRNPWDKMVSFYNFHKKYDVLDTSSGFNEFLSTQLSKWIPNNGSKYSSSMRSTNQIDWLIDSHSQNRMDFVGRFENFQEDFNIVCDRIGVPSQKLPHKNKSKHKHYSEYYNEDSIKIVGDRFSKDIKYFGYTFDE